MWRCGRSRAYFCKVTTSTVTAITVTTSRWPRQIIFKLPVTHFPAFWQVTAGSVVGTRRDYRAVGSSDALTLSLLAIHLSSQLNPLYAKRKLGWSVGRGQTAEVLALETGDCREQPRS